MNRATQEHIILVDLIKIIHPFNQRLYYLRYIIQSNGEQAISYNYFETNHNKKRILAKPIQIDEQQFQTTKFMRRFQSISKLNFQY
ncbi:unnamed protein product [Paramecium primaurelia]|uniref:Uncharacterized protein n=1 Tax=Paramecium primaurelia TaxID=5886 RepID=A0A8S1M5I7_PARPR|nr:unnamed protein product [Paramecium primaurelia]